MFKVYLMQSFPDDEAAVTIRRAVNLAVVGILFSVFRRWISILVNAPYHTQPPQTYNEKNKNHLTSLFHLLQVHTHDLTNEFGHRNTFIKRQFSQLVVLSPR
jgi:hypothetical protein